MLARPSQSAEFDRRMDALAREYLRPDEKSERRAETLKELSKLAALVEAKEPTPSGQGASN